MLLATKPPLQRGIKDCSGPLQSEEVEERGVEGEFKLGMQKLQLYHLLEFYFHQKQNTGEHLILFSDVLINNHSY